MTLFQKIVYSFKNLPCSILTSDFLLSSRRILSSFHLIMPPKFLLTDLKNTIAPSVCVIVLNYNGKQHLEYCLPSILESNYSNYQVIIVDNASTDGSLEYIKNSFPDLHLIASSENLGWAGGNNLGIQYAIKHQFDVVCLANNDIRVHPLWIESCVKAFQKDANVGFAGCQVFGEIREVSLEVYWKACKDFVKIEHQYTDNDIGGMALFVRTKLFELLGDFDETFFAYAEETDFEIRGKQAGFQRMISNVPVWHYSSGTFRKYKIKASYLAIRNHIRLHIKHESITKNFRNILWHYYIGCFPINLWDMENKTLSRIRSRSIFFNFFLITYCCLWNCFHLPNTLSRKQKDYQKINQILDSVEKNR